MAYFSFCFLFFPYTSIGNINPNRLSYFQRGCFTTNQYLFMSPLSGMMFSIVFGPVDGATSQAPFLRNHMAI